MIEALLGLFLQLSICSALWSLLTCTISITTFLRFLFTRVATSEAGSRGTRQCALPAACMAALCGLTFGAEECQLEWFKTTLRATFVMLWFIALDNFSFNLSVKHMNTRWEWSTMTFSFTAKEQWWQCFEVSVTLCYKKNMTNVQSLFSDNKIDDLWFWPYRWGRTSFIKNNRLKPVLILLRDP